MPKTSTTDHIPTRSHAQTPNAARLLKLSVVARQLGVSTITVRRRVRDGSLAHVRIRDRLYFTEADVQAFVARNHHGASSEPF